MSIIATTSPEINKALTNLHDSWGSSNHSSSCHHHQSHHQINLFPLSSSPASEGEPIRTTTAETEITQAVELEGGEFKHPVRSFHSNEADGHDDKENHVKKDEKVTLYEDSTDQSKKQTIYDDNDDDSLLLKSKSKSSSSSFLRILGPHHGNTNHRSHLMPLPPQTPRRSSSSSCSFNKSSSTTIDDMSLDFIGSPTPNNSCSTSVLSSKTKRRKPVHRRVSYDSLPSPTEIVDVENDGCNDIMVAAAVVVTPTALTNATMDYLNVGGHGGSGNDDSRSSSIMTTPAAGTQNLLTKTATNNKNETTTPSLYDVGGGDCYYYSSPRHVHNEPGGLRLAGASLSTTSTTRFSSGPGGPLFFPGVDL